MLRALRILTLIAVLFCALHVGEDAYAADGPAGQELAIAADAGSDDAPASSEAVAHAVHHHCPMADGLSGLPALAASMTDAGLLFAKAIAMLDSLSQAPPIDPPLA